LSPRKYIFRVPWKPNYRLFLQDWGDRPMTLNTFCILCASSRPCAMQTNPNRMSVYWGHGKNPRNCLCRLPQTITLRSSAIILYIPLMYWDERRNGQIIRGQMGLVGNLEAGGEGKPSCGRQISVASVYYELWSGCLYRGADKSLARPTSRCILFDGQNIYFDSSLVTYINSNNIPPIMIINRIHEARNLLPL
jgi:hypothetical protein